MQWLSCFPPSAAVRSAGAELWRLWKFCNRQEEAFLPGLSMILPDRGLTAELHGFSTVVEWPAGIVRIAIIQALSGLPAAPPAYCGLVPTLLSAPFPSHTSVWFASSPTTDFEQSP